MKRSADLAKAERHGAGGGLGAGSGRRAGRGSESRGCRGEGASEDLVNFLKQHPDLEKEVADDGSVEPIDRLEKGALTRSSASSRWSI